MKHLRAQFDLPRDEAYLNAAYIGPLPIRSVLAGQGAYQAKLHPWKLETHQNFFEAPEALRAQAAKLFHASADEIALVPAASYGLATAARNLDLKAGDEIVLMEEQFPSSVYTFRTLAQQTGAVIRTVGRKPGQTWTEALLGAITPQTALVACGAAHWIDGGRIDLEAISQATKAQGAALVLDLTQSLGMMDFDARKVDPDFAVTAAYKWLLGPYSIGFMYVAPRHHQGSPIEENWLNRAGSEDFSQLTDYRDGYQPGARRFDMGERSSHQLVPAAVESLQFMNDLGAKAIADHCRQTNEALVASVADLGFKDDTPDRADHYLALSAPDTAPENLAGLLREHGVHVSQRGPRLRVSAHVYNDEDDIALFANTLRALLK